MTISEDIVYVGVNDHAIDLFEGQYPVPLGMAYNSYVVKDDKVTVFDTVDGRFTHEWLDNIEKALGGRAPDYLVVQHMEPDHSANVAAFMEVYPNATVVSSEKAFAMMENFFGTAYESRRVVIAEGSTLTTGRHTFAFVAAPMVHWPEVVVTYDATEKVLFSADGFGKFGANDVEDPAGWDDEARRYYIGIVGKYGAQTQALLKKAAGLDIAKICPLHGPVLDTPEKIGHAVQRYLTWSSYAVEADGIVVAYTSVYGHTRAAVEELVAKLKAKGCPKVVAIDLARTDVSYAVDAAFRYSKLVLATTTYNSEIFPYMRTFISHLTERNFQGRTVALVENGSWAPTAARVMKGLFAGAKHLAFCANTVHIKSALGAESRAQMDKLVDELCREYLAQQDATANKNDLTALFRLGYGLYVVTSNDGRKDNGCIVNTVTQVTDTPNRVAVCINKKNYSHHVVKESGKLNVNILSEDAPFELFTRFGFQSGRTVDKFEGLETLRSDNGLKYLTRSINALLSLQVESYVDIGTHGMFVCTVTEARVFSATPTMTYDYYQKNVKPKPETAGRKGWVCKVCGYIHEGEELPEDFVCPLCKHGVQDFEKIES